MKNKNVIDMILYNHYFIISEEIKPECEWEIPDSNSLKKLLQWEKQQV